jgi:hypothetical protein
LVLGGIRGILFCGGCGRSRYMPGIATAQPSLVAQLLAQRGIQVAITPARRIAAFTRR